MIEAPLSRPFQALNPSSAPEIEMLRLAWGHIAAQAVYVFAALGVADVLSGGPKDAPAIAECTNSNAQALGRVLKLLVTLDVLAEDGHGRFHLTDLGRTMESRTLSVVRDVALVLGAPFCWAPIGDLLHTVRTGDNAFQHAHGQRLFEYLQRHPEDAKLFNASLDSASDAATGAILSAYDFSRFTRIVDLGCGKGALLTRILSKNPSARGVLHDLPHVIADIEIPASIVDRCSKIGGNFFEEVPHDGDVYILQQVLHDWPDDKAVEILERCRGVMGTTVKLLIIERAAPETMQTAWQWAFSDVAMMLLQNGRERTAAELDTLLGAAHFSRTRTIRTWSHLCIIEAVPC